MTETQTPTVQLSLSREAAIVLFEFLSRYTDTGQLSIADQAEQRVLWDLCAMMESQLNEPISPDYDKILKTSRKMVRDSTD